MKFPSIIVIGDKGGGWLTSPRWWSEAKQESSARKRFEADPHPTSDRDPRAQGMAREGEASGWGTPSRYNVYNARKFSMFILRNLLQSDWSKPTGI